MQIDYEKYSDGLVPAVIQDHKDGTVLMLGFMNSDSLEKTVETGKVTFYSRSKQRLWTKGEQSGNFMELVDMKVDCDSDTLLIQVKPTGPVCHLGTDSCFGNKPFRDLGFLQELESIIDSRLRDADTEGSYVARLASKGTEKVAQKVGEEAVEVVIEAMKQQDASFLDESADLLFHYLFLLRMKGFQLTDVIRVLQDRHK